MFTDLKSFVKVKKFNPDKKLFEIELEFQPTGKNKSITLSLKVNLILINDLLIDDLFFIHRSMTAITFSFQLKKISRLISKWV